jgi:hypothetical protein
MRVIDLLAESAEEDFPLIYDIIKAKLAAGARIELLINGNPGGAWSAARSRKLVTISPFLNDKELMVELRWRVGETSERWTHNDIYKLHTLLDWKLTKKDGYWELRI